MSLLAKINARLLQAKENNHNNNSNPHRKMTELEDFLFFLNYIWKGSVELQF